MNHKRILTLVLAGLMLLFGIACFCTGCGSSNESGDQSSQQKQATAAEELAEEQNADLPDYDGVYDSKEDVAAYLYAYGELPGNYMTKSEARDLGWEGGSLERFAPGMCIGGDHFGNYERVLPDDQDYHECDIDTLGASERGAKRLVYSEDDIYYTEDHYETFEQLYDENGRL